MSDGITEARRGTYFSKRSEEREKVYEAFDSEREYQDKETENPERSDMVENFTLGQALLAMKVNLDKAISIWYADNPEENFSNTMEYVRKVGGLCTKMGEKLGMPKRS
jgi:hypothetical protein